MIVAKSMEVLLCPNPKCRSVHFFMLDDDGKRIAVGAIPLSDMADFIKELQDVTCEGMATRSPSDG